MIFLQSVFDTPYHQMYALSRCAFGREGIDDAVANTLSLTMVSL